MLVHTSNTHLPWQDLLGDAVQSSEGSWTYPESSATARTAALRAAELHCSSLVCASIEARLLPAVGAPDSPDAGTDSSNVHVEADSSDGDYSSDGDSSTTQHSRLASRTDYLNPYGPFLRHDRGTAPRFGCRGDEDWQEVHVMF